MQGEMFDFYKLKKNGFNRSFFMNQQDLMKIWIGLK